jgi:hypothetical protein
MFTYSDQKFDTGIDTIDAIERSHSYSIDFTMNTGSGNYTVGETVYQGASLATATVKGEVGSWNSTTKILNLLNMTGNFSGTVNIIGDSSSATYSITSFDAQASAANTAATSSNVEIEAEADAIIDFTEGNPFGSL